MPLPEGNPLHEGDVLIENPTITMQGVNIFYGTKQAVENANLKIAPNKITALIGASGCGKSSLIRAINRMHGLTPGARVEGQIYFNGVDLYDKRVDPVEVRTAIGMVFQNPTPFPKSIFKNISWGAEVHGYRGNMKDLVKKALERAALWDEVKDKLNESALRLSGGQQQRLCIARALAIEPKVLLMDEPCSALDPIATTRIEDLMRNLVTQDNLTIIIVTHNMQQAGRVSDYTAYMNITHEGGPGRIVEYGETGQIFTNPRQQGTQDYITGRMG